MSRSLGRRRWTGLLAAAIAAAAAGLGSVNAINLSLAQTYEGSSFFDEWTFNASVIDNTTQGGPRLACSVDHESR
jgi:hypothetical protein